MIVRVGLPKSTGALPGFLETLGAPCLVSAGSLWNGSRFRAVPMNITDLDCALDSAGFVAMRKGGYRWEPFEYAALAHSWGFTWWSQMDLCCEPEVAADAAEIRRRLTVSAWLLQACRDAAASIREVGDAQFSDPVPVLQGWQPDDYVRCFDLYDSLLDGVWPELVGVGSMCTRKLRGPDGASAVLQRLEAVLPKHVQLHLFGVKGPVLQALHGNPRIASTDSMAWDDAARWRANKEGVPCSIELKKEEIRKWLAAQRDDGLFGRLCSYGSP